MSVATEFDPIVPVPQRARTCPPIEAPTRLASVTLLRPPRDVGTAAPLRLTRRGVVATAVLVAVLGLGVIWLGSRSAPTAPPAGPAPAAVTVQPGDTLWSIAARVAPDRDPRAEIDALQARNRLPGAALIPGQVLRVP